MKITVTRDFRCFKQGDTFELDLKPKQITFLIGPNGCGKSTLMFSLRTRLDSLEKLNQKNSDSMREMALMPHKLDVKANTEIEGFDFTQAFFRDTVVDNPLSFMNAATAFGLVSGGGLGNQNKSAGQGAINLFCRYVSDIVSTVGPESDERILIGIDEMDDCMDLKTQMRQAFIVGKMIFDRYPNASILFITHSLFTALGADHVENTGFTTVCYDVKRKKYTTPEKYFEDETGFRCTVTPADDKES